MTNKIHRIVATMKGPSRPDTSAESWTNGHLAQQRQVGVPPAAIGQMPSGRAIGVVPLGRAIGVVPPYAGAATRRELLHVGADTPPVAIGQHYPGIPYVLA